MKRRRPAVCSVPGCPHFRPCPATDDDGKPHEPQPWEGSDRKGSTRRGRKKRAAILERDPICTICGQAESTVCDHIWQVAHGAPEDYADVPDELLRGICDVCDKAQTAKQGVAGRDPLG